MAVHQVEYDILGTLYFYEPFDKILEEVDASRNVIRDALKNLLAKKLVAAYHYDEVKRQFIQAALYDTDNLYEYYFSATKKGIDIYGKGPLNDE